MKRGYIPTTPERDHRRQDHLGPSPSKRQKVRPDEEPQKVRPDEKAQNWTFDRLFTPHKRRDFIKTPKISHAKLIIDSKEKWYDDVEGNFKAIGVDCEFKPLEGGDYMWTGDGYRFDCCIERKTLDDLRKSLGDGRFESQNEKMKSLNMHNLFYLVEGRVDNEEDLDGYLEKVRNAGFKIIRTRGIDETFSFLENTTRSLNERIKGGKYKNLFLGSGDNKSKRRGPFLNHT